MFRNYLKVAWRNSIRYKSFTMVNVIGLALGICCCLLILMWVSDELHYDRFHANGKQLYWILANRHGETVETTEATPEPLAEALKSEISGVQEVTQFADWDLGTVFTVGQKKFKENGGIFASASFFQIFSFTLLKGNPQNALASPDGVVISQTLAQKYFGEDDPVNKVIQIHDRGSFLVTGVMADIPANSSIQADFVLPLKVLKDEYKWLEDWENFSINTVVQLHPNASSTRVENQIGKLLSSQISGQQAKLILQPFWEKYLHTIKEGKYDGGRIEYVRLFAFAAIFILIIACVNFTNLTTARASKRAKEVGVRKVLGAGRSYLITQFISDAFLVTSLAFVIAILLVYCLLPVFNSLTGKVLTLNYGDPYLLATLICIIPLTTLMGGSYPALFLASLEPYKVLKGSLQFGSNVTLLRKGLVVFQFLLSILLIIAAIVVHKQVNFIRTENLGLDRNDLLYVDVEGDLWHNRELFKQALIGSPDILSVTTSARIPINNEGAATGLEWPGMPPGGSISVAPMSVDYDFIKTMNIEMKEGRDFSRNFPTDSFAYIINESAAAAMNLKAPLGQTISFRRGKGKIIGVTKDFHLQSLHVPIRPLVLMLVPKNANHIFIRVQAGKTAQALEQIKEAFFKYNANFPFEYHFLDEQFEQQYKSENMVGQLASWFACIATVVSCLGLFGLALFSVEVRRKEIGIRKVIGASSFHIVVLLSKDFLKLVFIANLIAAPLAWWVMTNWLERFAYHTSINWWIFLITCAGALLISLFTVGYQTLKASTARPVKSLGNQ